jgi:hypothetical protein
MRNGTRTPGATNPIRQQSLANPARQEALAAVGLLLIGQMADQTDIAVRRLSE